MNVTELLTELLTNKSFEHNGKDYCFISCKKVVDNIMIITNKDTIQIPAGRIDDFIAKVKKNSISILPKIENQGIKTELPMKKSVHFIPENSKIFMKLNDSFEDLIAGIDSATEDNIRLIETKAKMLTQVAQTAVNMENSRISLIKLFNANN